MQDSQENPEIIHRIDPEASGESTARFEELVRLLETGSDESLVEHLKAFHHSDLADAFGLLDRSLRKRLIDAVKTELDPDLLFELEDHLRKEVTDSLTAKEVAEVITEMDSDEAVQVLEDMDEGERAEVLSSVPQEEREDIEVGLAFPEESAGRRMQTDVVTVGTNWTVGQTIDYLREESDLPEEFLDLFVVDEEVHPMGIISLSQILRSPRNTLMREIADETQVLIPAETLQEEVAFLFEKYDLTTAGVIDSTGKLLGMITVDDVMEVAREEFEEDILLLGGVGEETIDDGVLQSSAKRFAWLLVNLVTAGLASWVISMFDATIEQMVALAVLMPIVASMGGNAGTQTLTITVRALATKELTSYNTVRAIRKELLVGVLNGLLFAILAGVATVFIFGDLGETSILLGGIIAGAMVINMIVAGLSGVVLPILLDRWGVDPAVASGVFVTTVTDVVGFFAFLALASLVLL
ncbi:magnesium transporter [Opitutales bacterium]|nr:magnesium transporter [Opitutales bacterium]MDG1173942.1 magnesium transporter [Opitutales bacterium]